MTDIVTIQETSTTSPRKAYDEYKQKVSRLENEFSETDNPNRKHSINQAVENANREYGTVITKRAKAIWEEKLDAFDKADKNFVASERKAKRDLSKSASEHLEVARAEVRAAQDSGAVREVYQNAKGDTGFRYAVALEAQGRLGEFMKSAMESIDRAEISRVMKELRSDADDLHYTQALTEKRDAIVKQATELEDIQRDYSEINQTFRETSLNFTLNRLQIEREVLPDGRLKQTYFVAPERSYVAAIRRGLSGNKKYTEDANE